MAITSKFKCKYKHAILLLRLDYTGNINPQTCTEGTSDKPGSGLQDDGTVDAANCWLLGAEYPLETAGTADTKLDALVVDTFSVPGAHVTSV